MNLYGTDITAEKVVERFPDQNPNPVFKVNDQGVLVYANDASRPLIESYGLRGGDSWPAEIARQVLAAADDPGAAMLELPAGNRTYALRPVRIPEFDFINVYATDITAEKVVAKFPGQNPNPVLRMSSRRSSAVSQRRQRADCRGAWADRGPPDLGRFKGRHRRPTC